MKKEELICRGSIELGTSCGDCSKCKKSLEKFLSVINKNPNLLIGCMIGDLKLEELLIEGRSINCDSVEIKLKLRDIKFVEKIEIIQ